MQQNDEQATFFCSKHLSNIYDFFAITINVR